WAGADADSSDIDLVASTSPADGGDDVVTVGSGQAIVIGGQGSDRITGGTGTNLIFGDSGTVFAASSNSDRFGSLPFTLGLAETTAPGIGGNDTITIGTGTAAVFGGTGADTISTGAGAAGADNTHYVFGEDGSLPRAGP